MYVRDLRIGVLYYIVNTNRISVVVAAGANENRFYPLLAYDEFFPLADQLFAVFHNNWRYSPQQSRECLARLARLGPEAPAAPRRLRGIRCTHHCPPLSATWHTVPRHSRR